MQNFHDYFQLIRPHYILKQHLHLNLQDIYFFIVVCDFLDFNLAYSSSGLDVSFVFSSNKDGSTSNSSFALQYAFLLLF